MTEALRRHDFDTVLMALNAAQSANPIAARKMVAIPAFKQSALPAALQKNMGILSMKVMGQGMLVGSGAGVRGADQTDRVEQGAAGEVDQPVDAFTGQESSDHRSPHHQPASVRRPESGFRETTAAAEGAVGALRKA